MANAQWKLAIISPNRRMLVELGPLLAQSLPLAVIIERSDYPTRRELADLIVGQKPHLFLIDAATQPDRAVSTVSDIVALDQQTLAVALLPADDPDLILRLLRAGACEFVRQPFTMEQLKPTVERLQKASRLRGAQANGLNRVYGVMPSKGACGATTVAANLAHFLKRSSGKRVLLADLDPFAGTLSFLFKLQSRYSFLDVLARTHQLDSELWKGMVHSVHGMEVLLSPENISEGLQDLNDASSILQYARESYDSVVVDCGGPYGDWNLTIATHCDELLLTTTNELPALQATQRTLSYLEHHGIPRNRVKLLVNRFSSEVGLSREVIGTALGTEVFHVLPSDYDAVQRGLIEGKPVAPGSSFGKSLAQLGERLVGKRQDAPKKGSALSGLLGLFSRTSKS